jgi:hypothetical protein
VAFLLACIFMYMVLVDCPGDTYSMIRTSL